MGLALHHPRMLKHLGDCEPAVNVAVKHLADLVDAGFREGGPGNSERAVEDLMDVIERFLLIHNRLKQDA